MQKYLHNMTAWNALSTKAQEWVTGRTKLSDIELGDEVKPSNTHSALTTITWDGGSENLARQHALRPAYR